MHVLNFRIPQFFHIFRILRKTFVFEKNHPFLWLCFNKGDGWHVFAYFTVISTKLPVYIYDFIPPVRQSQTHPNTFNFFTCRAEYFKKTHFFPCVIGKWNKLQKLVNGTNPEISSSGSYNIFRKSLLNFIRPRASKVNDTIGIKLITRLRLGFSPLREHKFKHNFQDTLNPLCSCRINLSGQKNNNNLVSRIASDKKNFHPGGRKKTFLIYLSEFFK